MHINRIFYKRLSLIVLLIAVLATHSSHTQGQAPIMTPRGDATESNTEIERQKLDVERQKLQLEKLKVWLTAGSIFFPLVLGVLAIYSQVKTALKIRESEAKSAFELKAAEIVMNSNSPFAASGKATALALLFPDRIPGHFAASFDPENVSGPAIEEMTILLPLLIEHNDKKAETLRLWKEIFPHDAWWIDKINA